MIIVNITCQKHFNHIKFVLKIPKKIKNLTWLTYQCSTLSWRGALRDRISKKIIVNSKYYFILLFLFCFVYIAINQTLNNFLLWNFVYISFEIWNPLLTHVFIVKIIILESWKIKISSFKNLYQIKSSLRYVLPITRSCLWILSLSLLNMEETKSFTNLTW